MPALPQPSRNRRHAEVSMRGSVTRSLYVKWYTTKLVRFTTGTTCKTEQTIRPILSRERHGVALDVTVTATMRATCREGGYAWITSFDFASRRSRARCSRVAGSSRACWRSQAAKAAVQAAVGQAWAEVPASK